MAVAADPAAAVSAIAAASPAPDCNALLPVAAGRLIPAEAAGAAELAAELVGAAPAMDFVAVSAGTQFAAAEAAGAGKLGAGRPSELAPALSASVAAAALFAHPAPFQEQQTIAEAVGVGPASAMPSAQLTSDFWV